ncbi:hypothetical protein GOP47_0006143 [Adiantum capillus-veneris]|uniref:non-specific serine/threonine protein kinase n=1 Tax=Adiantum capillus-veneris TaxID=13818 RepID=A0A9D4ZLR8_ADICA|nr:hypothetical protein GOP47_0006143 [Adiantum capillus-veneris]
MADFDPIGLVKCSFSLADGMPDDDAGDFEEIDPSGRYGRYKDVLGRGAFKTVYKAFDRVAGLEVAWNQVKVQNIAHSTEDMDRLFSEVHLLKTLKHKNIIKFYHSWLDADTQTLNFLTELFTSGTLRQYRRRHRCIDIRAIKNWARQILRGLLYLHSHDPPIIHRDLKCDNILINGNQGEVKIGDLGLAAILRQAYAAHSVIGTPEFMAPELYEEDYTELVDIYAFGMCLLEMVTCEYPFSECENAAQIYKKVSSGVKPAALRRVRDPDLYQFIEKCSAALPYRLPARDLLMDPFLQYDRDSDYVDNLPFTCRGLPTISSEDGFHSSSSSMKPYRAAPASQNAASPSFSLQEFTPSDQSNSNKSLQSVAENVLIDLPSSHLIEDNVGQRMDLQVKGKRRGKDVVHLCLRLEEVRGDVRCIGFLFKLGFDTAMSVATEMVSELNLADQAVTRIAEIIDTALTVIAPDWKAEVNTENEAGGDKVVE